MEIDAYHLVNNRMWQNGYGDLCRKAEQAMRRADGNVLEAQSDDYLTGAVKAWNRALMCLSIELHTQQPMEFSVADIVQVASNHKRD